MQEALTRCMTYLDLAGNEVFPKQAVLDDKEGVSWVFMPYGDPDHCSFNETGGSITDSEFIAIFGDQYMDAGFLDIPKSNVVAFSGGNKQQKNTGKFNEFGATVQDVFKGGPYCLSLLAQLDSFTRRHSNHVYYFLKT